MQNFEPLQFFHTREEGEIILYDFTFFLWSVVEFL